MTHSVASMTQRKKMMIFGFRVSRAFQLRSNNFQPLLFLNLVQNEVDIFGYISGNAMPEFQQISKE